MESTLLEHIHRLLGETGIIDKKDDISDGLYFQEISADGSLRRFFRVLNADGASLCVGVYPVEPAGIPIAEAHSAMKIGRHLHGQGIQVPEILAQDASTGLILFEDCGDIRLHDVVISERLAGRGFSEKLDILYKQVIKGLVHMQWYGVQDFERSWCFDTPEYDHEVMIKKEAEYFLYAFWRDLVHGEIHQEINEEFHDIATHAANGTDPLFLHRDFQSRNIMVGDEYIRFIDFQGGRIGPPGYDIASLLIDPYSSLDEQKREELLTLYIGELQQYVDFDQQVFLKQYDYLALQRNLQIVGAFAFLFKKRGKPFFKDYIVPSLKHLCCILNKNSLRHYRTLRKTAEAGLVLARRQLLHDTSPE